jgi:drug/metabolite transporter (DMT)-like permease
MSPERFRGIIYGALAGIGWGSVGLWVKYLPIPATEIAFIRLLGSSFLSLGKRQVFSYQGMILGAILAFQFVLTITAFKLLSIGMATLTVNLHILFLGLLLMQFNRNWFITTTSIIFGLLLLFGISFSYGMILGLSASFLWALYTILADRFIKGNVSEHLLTIFLTGASLVGLMLIFTGVSLPHPSLQILLMTAGLIVFSTFIAHFSFLKSVKLVGTKTATALSYLAIPTGFVIDIAFGNLFTFTQYAGVILVVWGLVFSVSGE